VHVCECVLTINKFKINNRVSERLNCKLISLLEAGGKRAIGGEIFGACVRKYRVRCIEVRKNKLEREIMAYKNDGKKER